MQTIIQTTPTVRDNELLARCAAIARAAAEEGNHPFGALLADRAGEVLLTQGNKFSDGGSVMHAETLLVFEAVRRYTPSFLSSCTLYTSVEPCAMCSGAIYWSGIGRLVYGLSERDLLSLTGDNEENPTFDLPSAVVFSYGQRAIAVAGPTDDEDLRRLIASDHQGFWEKR